MWNVTAVIQLEPVPYIADLVDTAYLGRLGPQVVQDGTKHAITVVDDVNVRTNLSTIIASDNDTDTDDDLSVVWLFRVRSCW